MSTILRALQKQKLDLSSTSPAFIEKEPASLKWKVALFASLLVIICLLVVVIYLVFKPVNAAESAALATVPVAAKQQEAKVALLITQKSEENLIKKITFDLKPLPKLQPPSKVDKQLLVGTSVQGKQSENDLQADSATGQQDLLSATENRPQQSQKEGIDYSDTSTDLQQRFQRALSMSKDEDKEVIEQKNGDGSDIHQMTSEFQDQVPLMSYDFHMYSSVAKDRWIRINSEDLREGQFDSSGEIQVVEIQPNRTVFRLGRQSFSVESLTDWKGY